jgi:hypothetical protein
MKALSPPSCGVITSSVIYQVLIANDPASNTVELLSSGRGRGRQADPAGSLRGDRDDMQDDERIVKPAGVRVPGLTTAITVMIQIKLDLQLQHCID